jgi:hypothetical protein
VIAGLLFLLWTGYDNLKLRKASAFDAERAQIDAVVQRFQGQSELGRPVSRMVLADRVSVLQSIRAQLESLQPQSSCFQRLVPQLGRSMDSQIDALVDLLDAGGKSGHERVEEGRQRVASTAQALSRCGPDVL